MARIPLNPETDGRRLNGSARRFFLERNLAGRPIVVASDRSLSIDANLFLSDRYGDFPADAKAALPAALQALAA